MQKDIWYHKIFQKRGDIKKINIHMWTVWLLSCSQALNMKKKDKVQVPQWNEMLSLYCTALGFTSENEECSPK